jgi:transcription-repair coupling factor (superfamily II helicase)
VTNATVALRETAAVRPANAPSAQAGKLKPMREMLYITFSEKLHAAPQDDAKGLNVGALMKLVARNAKNGAQLTPQGTLRWPLSSAQADVVLTETRELLEMLRPQGASSS